jgi:hypothetical protein
MHLFYLEIRINFFCTVNFIMLNTKQFRKINKIYDYAILKIYPRD